MDLQQCDVFKVPRVLHLAQDPERAPAPRRTDAVGQFLDLGYALAEKTFEP